MKRNRDITPLNKRTEQLTAAGIPQLLMVILLAFFSDVNAQTTSSPDSAFKPSGKLRALAFGDFYYKSHSDIMDRGRANQYTGIEKGRNAFQLRRVYLGYNYDISPKFSAELLLAAEDNITNAEETSSGDLLTDNKLSPFLKLANIRWKNIWKGTDLVLGQVSTPAFIPGSDPLWSYRAVERTITDIRRTPSYDLGVTLQGKFDPETKNYGYNLMVGNGTGARPENNRFKWFYGDVYAWFFDKKVMADLYADYERLAWTPSYHHSRNMIKGFIAYTTPKFTMGVEAFINHGLNDIAGLSETSTDTLNATAAGVSVFARGIIRPDKIGFFIRMDRFNPYTGYNNNTSYTSYKGFSAHYEPNNRERFITVGLDFTPVKNVHIMPNIWYNQYIAQQDNLSGRANKDYDMVGRITFSFVFGG